MERNQPLSNREVVARVQNGWLMLFLLAALLVADIVLLATQEPQGVFLGVCILAIPVLIVLFTGLFSLQPNEARVLVLFGDYKGTVRESGFHWGNPFYSNGQSLAQLMQAQKGKDARPQDSRR